MKRMMIILFFMSLVAFGMTTVEDDDYQEPFDMNYPPVGRKIEQPYLHYPESELNYRVVRFYTVRPFSIQLALLKVNVLTVRNHQIRFLLKKKSLRVKVALFRQYLAMCWTWIEAVWALFS